MTIAFSLTGRHAEWLLDLYAWTQARKGPQYAGPSELARALLQDLLEDEARDNAAIECGFGDVLH